jgi:hypothetical protein
MVRRYRSNATDAMRLIRPCEPSVPHDAAKYENRISGSDRTIS